MRMWMVDPKIMCRKHLLGEHVELHMFVGTIKRKKRLSGYIKNNLLQFSAIHGRHQQLIEEMERRGYKHKSPITLTELDEYFSNYSNEIQLFVIDKEESLKELLKRCKECRMRCQNENKRN